VRRLIAQDRDEWEGGLAVRGVDAQTIGQQFAAAVRTLPAARRLWVGVEPQGFGVWLLTSAIPLEAERPFYEASVRLEDAFPDANLSFHLLNPQHFPEVDPAETLPGGVVEINRSASRRRWPRCISGTQRDKPQPFGGCFCVLGSQSAR
jgi:hypothetical protein